MLIIAGGEPFTRKDLPEIARAFHTNNKLESIYMMSNGQIQQRIIPDVTRILQECPNLNVTVALGIDGLKEEHETIRQKARQLGHRDRHRAQASGDQEGVSAARYPNLHLLHEQQSGPDLRVVRLPEVRSEAGQGELQLHPSAVGAAERTASSTSRDMTRSSQLISDDSRHAAIKNNYAGDAGFFKAAIDIYMHELIAKTALEGRPQLQCWAGTAGAVIYDEGTVSSCEILEAVGNLRELRLGLLSKLWYSPAMEARRETVANGCFCTHESNCYYPSLPFNPHSPRRDQEARTRDEGSGQHSPREWLKR